LQTPRAVLNVQRQIWASGIYEIRHEDAPDHFPRGNTVVIIGDTDVLVLDSCYLPSSAREDIAQIRKWTNKPGRYLPNTHWHGECRTQYAPSNIFVEAGTTEVGPTAGGSDVPEGLSRWQCCVHPWMRMAMNVH